MTTLYDFNRLSMDERAQHIWENGKLLTTLRDGRLRYNLYALADFFVEVQYNTTQNRIVGIYSFKKGEKLEKYLLEFDLTNLL